MPDGKMAEERIRRMVMEEVSEQLKPFKDMLKAVHDWQYSFWSNGSNRPPGFFQMRMKQDDERNRQLKDDLKVQTEVSKEIADFIREEKFRKEQREKSWVFWLPIIKWGGTALGTGILAVLTWIGSQSLPFFRFLWEDYLRYHPAMVEKLKDR